MVIYENNWNFLTNSYLKNFEYYGKKLWYDENKYDTTPKTMEFWFTGKKTMVLWKKYGTMEKTIVHYSIFAVREDKTPNNSLVLFPQSMLKTIR